MGWNLFKEPKRYSPTLLIFYSRGFELTAENVKALEDHLIFKYFIKPFSSHEIKSTLSHNTKDAWHS